MATPMSTTSSQSTELPTRKSSQFAQIQSSSPFSQDRSASTLGAGYLSQNPMFTSQATSVGPNEDAWLAMEGLSKILVSGEPRFDERYENRDGRTVLCRESRTLETPRIVGVTEVAHHREWQEELPAEYNVMTYDTVHSPISAFGRGAGTAFSTIGTGTVPYASTTASYGAAYPASTTVRSVSRGSAAYPTSHYGTSYLPGVSLGSGTSTLANYSSYAPTTSYNSTSRAYYPSATYAPTTTTSYGPTTTTTYGPTTTTTYGPTTTYGTNTSTSYRTAPIGTTTRRISRTTSGLSTGPSYIPASSSNFIQINRSLGAATPRRIGAGAESTLRYSPVDSIPLTPNGSSVMYPSIGRSITPIRRVSQVTTGPILTSYVRSVSVPQPSYR